MVKSPTGIIPEALMEPSKTGEVMALLVELPATSDEKESLLRAWSRTVGAKISGSQRRKVRFSGTDYAPAP